MDANKAHYIVATGIIVKDGKYLIAKRASHEAAFPDKWTVPGGKLNKSDYDSRPFDTPSKQWYNVFEDLLRREVLEEVGLKVRDIRYLASLVYMRSDNIPCLVISMFADYDSGEVILCKDLTDFRWVTLEEAKSFELIDGIYEELEMLDKFLKGKKIGEWGKEI